MLTPLRLVVAACIASIASVASVVSAIPPATAANPLTVGAPASVIAGETFHVTGAVSTHVRRSVRLEMKAPGAWVALGSVQSDRRGRYDIPVAAIAKTSVLRVFVPRARIRQHRYRAVTSGRVTVSVARQSAQLDLPATAHQGDPVATTATFFPARHGRPSYLQKLGTSDWVTIASALQDVRGRSRFSVATNALGTSAFRVVAPLWRGAPAIQSAPVGIQVAPQPEILPPTRRNGAVLTWAPGVEQDEGIADTPTDEPSISPDGRFVAFTADLTIRQPDRTCGSGGVFVWDRQTDTTATVTRGSDQDCMAGYQTTTPSVSADGRFVTYESTVPTLAPTPEGDTADAGKTMDVFLWDRTTGQTIRVSRQSDQDRYYSEAAHPVISANGEYIAYVQGWYQRGSDTSGDSLIRWSRKTGAYQFGPRPAPFGWSGYGDADFWQPSISADGSSIAFLSDYQDWLGLDRHTQDAFVWNADLGTYRRVQGTDLPNGESYNPVISSDGQHLVFSSFATNLFPGQTDATGTWHRFELDLATGSFVRLPGSGTSSTAPWGAQYRPAVSADGRYVALHLAQDHLALSLWDREGDGTIDVLTSAINGKAPSGGTEAPVITADGRFVAFASSSTNLRPQDDIRYNGGSFHVYLWDTRPPA